MSSYATTVLSKIYRPQMKSAAFQELLASKGFRPVAVCKTEKQVRRYFTELRKRFEK
jgi:hypothetical protein